MIPPREARVAAVVVAAGRGERAGQSAEGPKQYRRIGGFPVIAHTVRALRDCRRIGTIVVAIHPDDADLFQEALGEDAGSVLVIHGGSSRQESVRLALEALREDPPDTVLIHDGVRPFVGVAIVEGVIDAISPSQGALPALAVSDTLKAAGATGRIERTVPRAGLYAAQTPQGFPFEPIRAAHERALRSGLRDFTDDSSIAEWDGIPVRIVSGSPENVKLTWARDIEMADERLTRARASFPDVRTGNGYDVHPFEAGEAVWLCGVEIPHHARLAGHSDADVALHALTDALLATTGEGDIGTHFPPSDPQWKGAASKLFLEHAASLVRARHGRIANADITLICESPKIAPHREAMRASVAAILDIEVRRVSVKATTNEKLGFIGRGEGIAAIATASVAYPGEVPGG